MRIRKKRFAIVLLALSLAPAGAVAATPKVLLVSAPAEVRAGTPFAVVVRGPSSRVTVVARSPHGTTSVAARRSGKRHTARITVGGPGEWRLSARVGRRTYALGSVDARSAGADLVEPFRVALAPDGSLVIANGRGHNVLRLRGGRLERIAGVEFPIDAAVGPDGDVYVVSAHSIVRVDAETGAVTTFVAAARLVDPVAVAVRASGDVFVAEIRGRVLRADSTGAVSTVAEGFDRPHGLCVANDGTVFVADTYAGAVRRIDAATGAVTTVATGLQLPVHCAVAPDGSVLFADTRRFAIGRIARDGAVTSFAGLLEEPSGVAVAADGTVFASDLDGRRVVRLTNGGVTTIAR